MIAALAGEAAAQVFIQTSFSGAGCTGTAITTMTLNIAPLMPSGVTFGQCSAISGAWALASCVANNLTRLCGVWLLRYASPIHGHSEWWLQSRG